MSCCTNCASAFILSRGVCAEAVSVATCCVICAEASRRPLVKWLYQFPISRQLAKPLAEGPPGGKKETIIWPSTPSIGGISTSFRISFTSLTVHSNWLPLWVGLTSEELIHEAL